MHPYSPRPCTHRTKAFSSVIGGRCMTCKQVVPAYVEDAQRFAAYLTRRLGLG